MEKEEKKKAKGREGIRHERREQEKGGIIK